MCLIIRGGGGVLCRSIDGYVFTTIQSKNVPHLQLYVNGSLDIIFLLVVNNYFYCYTLLFQFLIYERLSKILLKFSDIYTDSG